MSSVSPIVQQRPVGSRSPRRRTDVPAADENKTPGTALVPVSHSEPTAQEDGRRPMRRSALFLAQLIANERQLPQTRALRRAEPQVVHAAYSAAAKLVRRR